MDNSYIEIVEQCIEKLVERFEQNPHFFYSESDVKCYLYHLLALEDALQGNYLTRDKKQTCLVHTEYPSVYRYLVDLVVLNPENIANYTFKRQRAICAIEIKLWSNAVFNLEKEKQLRDRLSGDVQAYRYIIYLAKKESGWQEFKDYLSKYKKEDEEIFLESTTTTALVTRKRSKTYFIS